MKPAFNLVIAALLVCSLGGCGQRGPLYLPGKPAPQATPVPSTVPPPVLVDDATTTSK